MDAGNTTSAAGSATAPRTATAPDTGKSAISSDFETFLKMLSTQLQNQDPLNPVDSADYAVQLATFSSVEQQVLTNDLLQGIASRFSLSGFADYATWVGMEARSEGDVSFDGTPISVSPSPDPDADRTVMIVRNAEGSVVARVDIPISDQTFEWTGADGQGGTVPSGSYSLSLENQAGGEVLSETPMETYSRVREVRRENGAPVLILAGGIAVPADSVTALRQP